ncbi:MAG: KamA family radical SAM protein [Chloroflexi bacterium]|nr:KamA family radical SAM protein [Chloroflexota bacterium]
MKTSSVASRTQVTLRPGRHYTESCRKTEAAEEPPSTSAVLNNAEEEPPSKTATRYKRLGHIPDNLWNDWRWHFRNRITTVEQLSQFIPLSSEDSVTPHYLSLIDLNDPDDPIRKQAIPSIQEMTMSALGMEDPLEEKKDSAVPGLVHRYPDRALMVLTNICPMLCRHCTRKREWRNGAWVRNDAEIQVMLDYVRRHKEVRDVIISGGDPLTLSTRRLEGILSKIRAIEHVEIIRIGTRFPVVLPQRIDAELCNMLSKYGPIWLNTHFNHVREITPEAAVACDRLVRSGVPVNNQTVLLRGVNDSVEAQMALCHGLLRIKVRPYYLFQCDEVQGTEHLRTPVEVGIKVIEGMRGHTSGLAIPTFVVDLSHGGGKVPLQPNYVLSETEDELVLRNYEGRVLHYRNPGRGKSPEPAAEVAGVSGGIALKLAPEGERNADRVIVRP